MTRHLCVAKSCRSMQLLLVGNKGLEPDLMHDGNVLHEWLLYADKTVLIECRKCEQQAQLADVGR